MGWLKIFFNSKPTIGIPKIQPNPTGRGWVEFGHWVGLFIRLNFYIYLKVSTFHSTFKFSILQIITNYTIEPNIPTSLKQSFDIPE